MKDIVSKEGFTLVELLAVIVIIGVLALIVVPATTKIMNDSINKTMKIQETEIVDAALMYLEDYCKSPLDRTHICTLNYTIDDASGTALYGGRISLSTLIETDYINTIKLRGATCGGYVDIIENEAKAYIMCSKDEDNVLYTTPGYTE